MNQQQQVKEGIDAVIVDNVLAIRQGLTAKASKSAGTANWPIATAEPVDGVATNGSVKV